MTGSATCPLCNGRGTLFLQAPDRLQNGEERYDVLRCSSCTLAWLADPPSPEQMERHYGGAYHLAVTRAGESGGLRRWRIPVQRVHQISSGGSLLDMGCSSGGFLESLKNSRWMLHGIEISDSQARRAAERSGANVFVGDVLDARFPPESFDVITGLHVLEHFYHPKEVLQRVWEWLKPGGLVYLQVPNIDALEAHLLRSYWYPLDLPRHLYHFSSASLRKLAELTGFEEYLLRTQSESYVEESVRYVFHDLRSKQSSALPHSLTANPKPAIPWRVVRKALRMGVIAPWRVASAMVGRGASLEAVFRKSVRIAC